MDVEDKWMKTNGLLTVYRTKDLPKDKISYEGSEALFERVPNTEGFVPVIEADRKTLYTTGSELWRTHANQRLKE